MKESGLTPPLKENWNRKSKPVLDSNNVLRQQKDQEGYLPSSQLSIDPLDGQRHIPLSSFFSPSKGASCNRRYRWMTNRHITKEDNIREYLWFHIVIMPSSLDVQLKKNILHHYSKTVIFHWLPLQSENLTSCKPVESRFPSLDVEWQYRNDARTASIRLQFQIIYYLFRRYLLRI